MGKKVLSISFLEDRIDILKVEQGVTYTFTAVDQVRRDVDEKTLRRAASWADDIYINGDFSSAEYYWDTFPKVTIRQLSQLVQRRIRRLMDLPEEIRIDFQDVGPVTEAGILKREVAFIGVSEKEVGKIESDILGKVRNKIQLVTPLPLALCAAVVQAEHPSNNFMIIWCSNLSTIFAICSPQGDIKVARNIPMGYSREGLAEDDKLQEQFSDEFDRDITSTLLLYSDRFGEQECREFYFLGNDDLAEIFSRHPLNSVPTGAHFSLSPLPVRNIPANDHALYPLVGNLFLKRHYNLVDKKIIHEQLFDKGYKISLIILTGMIIAAGAWLYFSIPINSLDNNEIYQTKKERLARLEKQLYNLQARQIELKRYSGWRDFYKNTYTNQPAWSKMTASLAAAIPQEFSIKELTIRPGKGKGVHGWTCVLTGHIKVEHWDDGLRLLRQFGTHIEKSPYFDVEDISYTTLEDEKKKAGVTTEFDFVITMKLVPQETSADAS